MSLTYQVGRKGKKHLIFEGYEYQNAVQKENKVYFRCVESRNSNKCQGKVHVQDRQVVFNNNFHNHTPNIARILAKRTMRILKAKRNKSLKLPLKLLQQLT